MAAAHYAEARDAFRRWLAQDSTDARARLGLGAAFEGLGALDSARAIYAALGATRLPARVRRQLDARVRLLARRELAIAAKQAVADEARLSREPPRPNAVAVLPFRFVGTDSTLKPLERGLAFFFITDLGQISSLTLLEREQIQALLDELALTDSGRVDPATGARSGRLLRAAEVLQGTLQERPDQRLRLDASMVTTTTAEVGSTASAEDRLRQIFDMQKAVLFELLDRLGVTLTPRERDRLAARPTANFLAFLAFSRGLEAEDRGDFTRAAAEFRRAASLDPTFQQASQRSAAAASVGVVAAMSPVQVSGLLDPPVPDVGLLLDNLDRVMLGSVQQADETQTAGGLQPPFGRDQLGEVGGEDRIVAPGIAGLEIIVRRPP